MSRTLSSGAATEVARPVTLPGYLVSIAFSVPVRLSTRGDVTWDAMAWSAAHFVCNGLAIDGTPEQDGSLVFTDTDGTIAALILSEGIQNRAVNVWKLYGETPADDDPVLIFSGVGDGYAMDYAEASVTIGLKQAETLYAPRQYINAASGFNWLPAPGTAITWGGETFALVREQS